MAMTSDVGRRDLLSVRRSLRRLALVSCCEIYPGSREYRRHAHLFMPLEVRLGQEVDSLSPVTWRPGQESNGFFLMLGASGAGKTETLKAMGRQILEHGIPVLVLDFHGDVQVPGLASVLMSSGTASWAGINPMEIDCQRAELVGLYDQRMALLDLLARAIPQLGHQQRQVLSDALKEAYLLAGIRDEEPSTWALPPPTFSWVLDILWDWAAQRGPRRATVQGCIAVVESVFGHPLFSRLHHVSLQDVLDAGLRLDLSKVPDSVRFLVADTVLRKLFRMLSLQGHIPVSPQSDAERFRLFVIIDEAKLMAGALGDPDDSRLVLNLLITEARKFGIGLILASQMREHFGTEVRGNAATWLVLKPMDRAQAKRNGADVGVTPEGLLQLRGRGEGFLRSQAGNVQLIQIHALPLAPDSGACDS